MPIQGKFYQAKEIQSLLHVGKQRVANLAKQQNWKGPQPGLYYAECVEWYLMGRGIDPAHLPVTEYAPMAEYSPGQEDDEEE